MGLDLGKLASDCASLEKLKDAVKSCETRTDAEIVVLVAKRSGPYRDARYRAGIISVLIWTVVAMLSPAVRSFFLPGACLVFAAAFISCDRFPALFRRLTSEARRSLQVEAAAELAFVRSGVSRTQRRTGLLVYVSTFEKDGHLLGDVTVRRKVPGNYLSQLQYSLDRVARSSAAVDDLASFIREDLAAVLERFVPAGVDNPNELTDETTVLLEEVGPIS